MPALYIRICSLWHWCFINQWNWSNKLNYLKQINTRDWYKRGWSKCLKLENGLNTQINPLYWKFRPLSLTVSHWAVAGHRGQKVCSDSKDSFYWTWFTAGRKNGWTAGLVWKAGMMAEDWNVPEWANGAKEHKQRETSSLRMGGRVKGYRLLDQVAMATARQPVIGEDKS